VVKKKLLSGVYVWLAISLPSLRYKARMSALCCGERELASTGTFISLALIIILLKKKLDLEALKK